MRATTAQTCPQGPILLPLRGALKTLQGRFILSLNDRPEVRETFKAFAIEGVDVTYSLAGGKGKAVKEVIVTG